MSSSFNGFSEEDIQRLKTQQNLTPSDAEYSLPPNLKKIEKIGGPSQRRAQLNKLAKINDEHSDQGKLNISFDKCKLSLKTPTDEKIDIDMETNNNSEKSEENIVESLTEEDNASVEVVSVVSLKPDVVSNTGGNYNEATGKAHTAKLQELQTKQKLMEEQNRKRKEMLAKALADRTKQTEEEVMKLEKIKKELLVLDGQFSQDVAVLRKKIDQACLTYGEAEKQYLRVEREFLQAKLNLQREKEKKELLSEHLCALITHNETRKAQKLVTLMEQLAYSGEHADDREGSAARDKDGNTEDRQNENLEPIVVDGVDERTGKMMEINDNFS